jgi:hypothetical protein
MGLSPLAHALDICATAEVIAVSRFAQPAAMALKLTGGAALGLGAELLMPAIASVGIEQLFAMQTLTLIRAGHPRW